MNRSMKTGAAVVCAAVLLILTHVGGTASAEGIARITGDVATGFGVYRPVVVDVTPSIAPYTVEDGLANVANAADFDLDPAAADLIERNGFACTASPYRQPYDIYNECLEAGIPVFVTTDACLHTYHVLYDYMLRILEVNYFIDDIERLTETMIEKSFAQYDAAGEKAVKAAALDNAAYFSVALKLLDPGAVIDDRVAARVGEEVAQIMSLSDGYAASPLFYTEDYPFREDYSQYKPRGHYTRSEELERYFRAMMWYGRITFSLDLRYATDAGLRHVARQAILAAAAVEFSAVGNEGAAAVWDRIYQPTVFFVGEADDILYRDYWGLVETTFSANPAHDLDVLADDAAIDKFMAKALDRLPDPAITVVAGKGMRFMGQRFIPDSYVLDQLVEEFVYGRLMPKGLDVMAVMGSARAYEILDTVYGETRYVKYDEQMTKLKAEFASYKPAVWAQNLYYNWLYSLAPLLDVKGEGYPFFMRNASWVDKDLNTALGSWAELRHDTILYAKQSETFETAQPEPPDLVMGYVEPQPEVYARLAALAAFMRDGLAGRNLLHIEIGGRLDDFADLMMSLTAIAVKELENVAPTDREYALICNFGRTIEDLVTFGSEHDSYQSEADDYMAVIADVHTDPNLNEALEVGVGHPLSIYVVAPVEGVPTLTKGAVFSYHEFKQSLADERLTDEEWQKMQSGPEARQMPVWTESFVAGPSSTGRETSHRPYNGPLVTGVEEELEPAPFMLRQNVPNPFNPSTLITYRIAVDGKATLAVYNLAGQLVDVLAGGHHGAGEYSVTWKPENLSSGVYIVRLTAGSVSSTIKMLYMK